MDWLVDNWYMLVAVAAIIAVVVVAIIIFVKKPTSEQLNNLKEWLLYAVMEAERLLGSKMGQAKLRLVYDMAIERFGWIAKIIPFTTFARWVDEALERFEIILNSNEKMREYIE